MPISCLKDGEYLIKRFEHFRLIVVYRIDQCRHFDRIQPFRWTGF